MDIVARGMASQNGININGIMNQLGMGQTHTTVVNKVNTIADKYVNLVGALVTETTYSIDVYSVSNGDSYRVTGQLWATAGVLTVCSFFADAGLTQPMGKTAVEVNGTTVIDYTFTIPSGVNYMAVNNIDWYSNINVYPAITSAEKLSFQAFADYTYNKIIAPNGTLSTLSNFTLTKYAIEPSKTYKIKGTISGNANSLAIFAYYSDATCTSLISVGQLCQGWSTTVDIATTAPTGATYMAVTNYNGHPKLSVYLSEPMAKLDSIGDSLRQLNPLYGKKIGVCGDSMTAGNGTYAGNCWAERLAIRNNMTIDNQALNGKYLTQSYSDSVVGGQVNLLSDDCDYVVIYAGTNDITNSVAIGNDTDSTVSTLKGTMNVLIPMLLTKYPSARVCFITPYRRYIRTDNNGTITFSEPNSSQADWINAIEYMCGLYGIPCFNNMKHGGIYWKNDAQRALYMSDGGANPYGDDTHLTNAGIEFASTKYERFLRTI